MKYDVITIGSATQDVFLSSGEFSTRPVADFDVGHGLCLPLGSKVAVDKIVFASGGGGTNAAVTLARQGLKVASVGVLGRDPNGTAILDELRREGVDAKWFQVHDDDITAYSAVLVTGGGERTILSYKGEGAHWRAEQVPWDAMDSSWAYVNSLGGHLDVLEATVRWASARGVHLATNPGHKEIDRGFERLAPLWKHFDIVGMNQEEAAQLVGIPYEREADIFRAMDEAIGGVFIMTKGSAGVTVSDGHFLYSAGVPETEVIERTGAGDAFHSGFLAEFIRSGSIERAIEVGTDNATSVTMHYGAKQGILRSGARGSWPRVQVEKKAL